MVFTVLGSLYGPEGPPGADKSGGGTCWNKMFNGGSCPHLRDAAIYKKSLKKINELHYQLWTWGG